MTSRKLNSQMIWKLVKRLDMSECVNWEKLSKGSTSNISNDWSLQNRKFLLFLMLHLVSQTLECNYYKLIKDYFDQICQCHYPYGYNFCGEKEIFAEFIFANLLFFAKISFKINEENSFVRKIKFRKILKKSWFAKINSANICKNWWSVK